MESNISRDQVQLEVLCALIKAHTVKHQTIWNRIGSALGLCKPKVWVTEPGELAAKSFAITSLVMEVREFVKDKNMNEIIKKLEENETKE